MSKAHRSEMKSLYKELSTQQKKTIWGLISIFLMTVGGVASVVYIGIVGILGIYLLLIHIVVGGFRWIFG